EDGKAEDVVELIKASLPNLPPSYRQTASVLLLNAEGSLAFDRQDYDEFLAKAEAMAREAPDHPATLEMGASALAAQYAATGDGAYRTQALEALARCRNSEVTKVPGFAEFDIRMQHRLATGQILSPKQFAARFPQGWKPAAETEKKKEKEK